MTGCTTYKYKAWLKAANENAWSAGSAVDTQEMAAPGTPVVTVSERADNSFKLSWPDVARASGYLLSVWTGGGAGTVTETFNSSSLSGNSYSGNTSITGGDLGTWTSSGARGDETTADGTMAPTIRYQNWLKSPALPGAFTSVSFDWAFPYKESSTATWNLELYINDSATPAGTYEITGAAAGTTGTATFTGLNGAAGDTIMIFNAGTGSDKRVLIDNIVISGPSKTYVAGYGEAGGAATSPVTVSGLAQGTRYDYKVWAVGATTACKSETPAEGYTTTTGTQAPGKPGLGAVANGADGMTVTATAGSPAGSAYVIYRFATEAAATAAAAQTPPSPGEGWTLVSGNAASGTGVADTGLLGCTRYWYVAWAVNGSGASAVYSPASSVASAETATVGTPSGLDETSVGAHGATLAWTGTAGASDYAVSVWHVAGGTKTVSYTPEDWASDDPSDFTTVVSTTGTAPEGSSVTFTTDNRLDGVSAGHTVTLRLTGFTGQRITGVSLHASSEKNEETGVESGAGSFTMKVGNTTIASIANSSFSSANWNGAWSYAWVNISPAVTATTVGANQDVVLTLTGSEDTLWCDRYTITYEGTGRVYDVADGVAAAGVTLTHAAGATSATVSGLEPGTSYGWSVAATAGCTGDAVADSDGFTTDELVPIPEISEPLTVGVGSLGGTVTATDAEGATLVLKRYEDPSAADAATGAGSLGGVVVATTGADGSWSFAETGLDGCKAYYYRAWLKKTVDGVEEWSKGSVVVGARTELGTPVVTALGAGTTILLSWPEVKGATSYDVTVSSDASFRPGAATTRVSEDFDAKNPSGWTFSGTGWYDAAGSSMKYGSSGCAVKFDTDGDSVTTPAFTAGATSLSFWMKASDSGSSLVIEALEGVEWKAVRTVSAGTTGGGETVDLSDHATATQLRFTISRGKGNIGLDHVTVTGPGSGGTIVFTSTVTAAPYSATVPGLEQGHTYYYRVTAHGSGECDDKTAEGQATPENAALIMVSPKHYNFGTVNKNEGGATATFTVRNTGNRDLTFTEVNLVQDGTAYSITQPATAVDQTAAIPAGGERTYTVKFDPVVSGTRTATLQFLCNAANADAVEGQSYKKVEIPLEGTCYDPATADPTVYWLEVEDELGIEDTVTDESMAHEDHEPVLTVLTWHYNRSYRTLTGEKAARWTLYDPAGNVATKANGAALENQPFTAVEDYVYDGKTCAKFSVPIPALGTGKAVRGTYTVKVKVWDSTETYCTETTHFVPIETGWLFDDFTRADREATGSGALENGWTALTSGGAVAGEAAIHADALELYGANGECTKQAGRIAVARDMSDVGYATDPHDFVGTGSWGFHFKTGAKTVGFGDGSTAGAFVLGSTASTWLTATPGQVGYAVAMRDDAVQLVKFEGSLLAGGTITQLGEAQFAGTQGKLLAVRVDFLPGQDEVDADAADDGVHHDAVPAKFRLYVKEVAKTGGSPIAECTAADKVLEYEFPEPENHELRYAGMMWNHGVAQVSDKTGAMFDDIYLPHMEGQTEPMMFHVIDEDTEGPEFYGISLRGAVAAPDVAASGLTVTGMVHDASGVAGNVAWAVYNGETLLTSGTATPAAVSGSSTEYTLSCTIPAGTIDGSIRSADCRFVLTASDGDDDRYENSVNIDSSEGTGSFPFTLCASTPAAPAWATAEADGAEMVVLRWARAAAGTQYIVVRSDEEIGDNASPQGRKETMAEGTTVEGWGTVVYNGTGDNHLTGTWTAREFIVAPGSTNYFAVYGMTGGDAGTGYYFSAPTKPNAYAWATTNETTGEVTHYTAVNGSGVPVESSVTEGGWPCTTATYEPGEGVDSFAYRTSVSYPESELREGDTPASLSLPFNSEYDSPRPKTGSGWGNDAWTGDTGTWKIHDGNLETWRTHFPTPAGNKLYWEDTSSSAPASATLYRPLAAENTSDKFFVAGMMNYGGGLNESMFNTAGTWMSIALVDDHDNVLVSFGKQGGSTKKHATMQVPVGQFGVTGTDPVECRNNPGEGESAYYTLNPGHGQDYILAGEVDREHKMLRMWVFYAGQTAAGQTDVEIPQVYEDPDDTISKPTALESVQASWSWEDTAPNWAGKIAGIKLIAGSDGSHQLGHVYFDEIRFATTWPELFLFNDPEVYTYDFANPEPGTGRLDPVTPEDEDGHKQWQISDGALAHGDVGLNAQFGLFHRTGISSANFTIKDAAGNPILKSVEAVDDPSTARDDRLALETDETGHVRLSGTEGHAYSDWKTPAGGATGVAIPTNRISLEETYTVEVTLTSAGGREATVTSASETGGAGSTDLFFGEYGEGRYWDKYVEIYNGTGHDVDLYDYYIFRPASPKNTDNDFSTTYDDLIPHETHPFARISPTKGENVIGHGETIVLLNWKSSFKVGTDDYNTNSVRIAAMEDALNHLEPPAKHIRMPNEVLDSSGDVPYLLVKAEDFNEEEVTAAKGISPVSLKWLDACGMATAVVHHEEDSSQKGRYIMSRKNTATYLPRSKPLIIDTNEWDYRDWSWPWKKGYGFVDDHVDGYANFIETAGVNDRKIGLGGNMEFKVFDDDTDAPVLNGGGVTVGSRTVEGEPGDRTYVMGGWSFATWPEGAADAAGLTLEQYGEITGMWSGGMTTNGGVSWSPVLGGTDLEGYAKVIESNPDYNTGQGGVDFDGLSQVRRGDMIVRAGSLAAAGETEAWLGFDLDVSKLTDAVLTFGFAGGNAGFQSGRVEVSTTGLEGSFKMPLGWDFPPNTGGASTWDEWSGDLAEAIKAVPEVATAGHLWFRVVVRDYGTASGTFRLDNMRLEGAPELLRVSDAELNTQNVAFDAQVVDAASGLDAETATFEYGVEGVELDASHTLNAGGKSESTFTWSKTGGFEKAKVQEWYTNSLSGQTQLRVKISDKDDDRPGDALKMTADYGMLDVYDDDDEPPVLEMESMKPRKEGTFAEWLMTEKTAVPSETMAGLEVGPLGLNTTAGTESKPRYSGRNAADTGKATLTYAVYQSGWQAGSKFWSFRVRNTTAGSGSLTGVSFWSKVGSVLAPTGFEVKYGTVTAGEFDGEASGTWTKSLLTGGTAWVKEGSDASGSPIKTWAEYSLEVAIPLAAAGEPGDEVEVRIYGTGTDPDGIGATWYLWDLKVEGALSMGSGGDDGITYVTDATLASADGARLPMSGSVYDEGSGLAAAPTYTLTNTVTKREIATGTITGFTTEGELSGRKTKADGAFSQNIALGTMGYSDLGLVEYKGSIHAVDADYDREDAAGNNTDQVDMDGQFAFTVIDQDLVGPTAPANVKVNGTTVPNAAPEYGTAAWNDAPWTNKPEFLVSFDVAEDVAPTAANLADATWLSDHGVEAASVKKASMQTGAAGIGEYRVALATGAAVLSNAPAYSVAVAEGAVANYGFERTSEALQAWRLTGTAGIRAAGDRAFPGSTTVAPAPCEGTNSLFVPSGNVGGTGGGGAIGAPQSQVILFENTAHVAPKVGGSFWYYKVKNTSSPRVRISAYPNEDMVAEERIAFRVVNPSTDSTSAGEWHQATFEFEAIGDGNANCILLELYSGTDYSFFDDVRIGVDVGTGNLPTMRYVATGPEAQGLNAKHLFAVDADNNRKQDRMVGETAVFYTPYDCTPPTAVAFIGGGNHGAGASTDHVDDPTTQFDLTWTTSNVGPDDTKSDEYAAMPAANKRGRNSLSPWGTFRVYYRTYDPIALEAAATEAKAPSTAEYLYKTLVCGPSDGWNGSGEETAFYHDPSPELGWKHVENGDEIEDVTAPEVGGKRQYSGWNVIGAGSQQTVRLYDLDFDQEYVVVVVGVDKAGNEGPVTVNSWATNNTIKFSLTRGWHMPKTEAVSDFAAHVQAQGVDGDIDLETSLTNDVVSALEWTAAGTSRDPDSGRMVGNSTKDYDLLHWDARSFRESPDNNWQKIATVRTSWFVDDGGPTNRGSIRFYRASYKDRWMKAVTNAATGQVTAQTPLVSEEVYAQTAVPLRPGPNFVALHGVPYTNTFRAVFGGTENFPGGVSETLQGTSIDFYPAVSSTNGIALDHYWLRDDGQWFHYGDEENAVTDTRQDPDFFNRAFSINLPDELPEGDYPISSQEIHHPGGRVETVQTLLWKPILQVPTNGFSQTIHRGTKENPKFNIMALRLPVAAHPSEMGLVVPTAGSTETEGLTPGQPWVADQIYTIDPVTRDTSQACYCRMEDGKPVWRFAAGNGLVPAGYFKPNDVLLILSRNGGDAEDPEDRTWTWEYDPADFYPLPHRNMKVTTK